MNRILLVTSIAPKGIEKQKIAIESWLRYGFDIISCNTDKEIAVLQELFPQVIFETVYRTGEEITGYPCPYIFDMFQALKKRDYVTYGIINSDIVFYKFPRGMYEFIVKEAKDSLIYVRRQEITNYKDVNDFNFHMEVAGIDAFFFDSLVIKHFEEAKLFIGAAAWDSWMLINAKLKGIRVSELINPIAFHQCHPIKWSRDIGNELIGLLLNNCSSYIKDNQTMDKFYKIFTKILGEYNSAICFCEEKISEIKVGILIEDRYIETKQELQKQTHKKWIIIKDKIEAVERGIDCIIHIKNSVRLYPCFIDCVLQVMNDFSIRKVKIPTYFLEIDEKNKYFSLTNADYGVIKNFNDVVGECIKVEFIEDYFDKDSNEDKMFMQPLCYTEVDKYSYTESGTCIQGDVYVYPAGFRARQFVKEECNNAKLNIIGFCDRDVSKWGLVYEGKEVFQPNVLKQYNQYHKVIIVCDAYEDEIYESLKAFLPTDKIVKLEDCRDRSIKNWSNIIANPYKWLQLQEEQKID